MPELIEYLLKVSLGLTVGYLFYSSVLRSLTFYTWIRWFLLVYTVLSFTVPLVDVGILISSQPSASVVVAYIPSIEQVSTEAMPVRTHQQSGSSDTGIWWQVQILMLTGSAIMAIRDVAANLIAFADTFPGDCH